MQRAGLDTRTFQLPRHAIRAVLRAGENEHAVERRIAHQVREQRGLQMLGHFIHELRDCLRGIRAASDLHSLRRVLELVRERLDLLRERGGKHQRLALLWQPFHDPADGRQEAHVEHPVGFIQHEMLQPREIAVPEKIQQPARRGDDDIRPAPQRLDLRALADSAENRRDPQRQMLPVSAHILLNLHDEFARRRDDQRTRPAAQPACELREDWQGERRRLARACLRDADQVVTFEDQRDGGGLDRSRLGVTGFLNGFENVGIEAEGAKWHGLRTMDAESLNARTIARDGREAATAISPQPGDSHG